MPDIETREIGDIWFQHHIASMGLLREHFSLQINPHFGPLDWPLGSYDIAPLDVFLGGYVKIKVYADNFSRFRPCSNRQLPLPE